MPFVSQTIGIDFYIFSQMRCSYGINVCDFESKFVTLLAVWRLANIEKYNIIELMQFRRYHNKNLYFSEKTKLYYWRKIIMICHHEFIFSYILMDFHIFKS